MNKMLTTMAAAALAAVPVANANSVGDGLHATAKCFYECKNDATGTRFQEVTTMVIPEPFMAFGVYNSAVAQIRFFDGNYRLVASTHTLLPPYDVDEINVCATIEQATGPSRVPSAGLIDISYHASFDGPVASAENSPVMIDEGSFAPTAPWVKNVLGSFAKSAVRLRLTDPFVAPNSVRGIAKTECRLNAWEDYYVGPDVLPLEVPPAYIEATGEDDLAGW